MQLGKRQFERLTFFIKPIFFKKSISTVLIAYNQKFRQH